ncbi:MAG: response regulator [Pseudomonadota bacterium]
MTKQVLLIEDDDALRMSLTQTMELAGLTPLPMTNFVQAKRRIRSNFQGVILSDIRMPNQDGFDVLSYTRNLDPQLPVILITGHSDVPTAMRAVREGAYDYLEKPCNPDRLREVLERALDHREVVIRSRSAERALLRSDAAALHFPGQSEATESFCAALRRIATGREHVHIFGPEGTGKKQAAYVINQLAESMPPFLRLNFRVVADDAVVRLDLPDGPFDLSCKHLDAASARQQSDLVSLLLARPDARMISSSTRALSKIRQDILIEDLDLADQMIELRAPSLAERREDLPIIFEQQLRLTIRNLDGDMPDVPEMVMAEVMSRAWPGNLPELRAFASSFALGNSLRAGPPQSLTLAEQMDGFERLVLIETLKQTGGRASEAASALGLPRNTFYDRLAKHRISAKDYRASP